MAYIEALKDIVISPREVILDIDALRFGRISSVSGLKVLIGTPSKLGSISISGTVI